jgi:hypothetical protein
MVVNNLMFVEDFEISLKVKQLVHVVTTLLYGLNKFILLWLSLLLVIIIIIIIIIYYLLILKFISFISLLSYSCVDGHYNRTLLIPTSKFLCRFEVNPYKPTQIRM